MKCLIEGCDGISKTRGLCPICYQAAAVVVKRGDTTWKQLEEVGFANEPQHKGSGCGAFTKALRKMQFPMTVSKEEVENET